MPVKWVERARRWKGDELGNVFGKNSDDLTGVMAAGRERVRDVDLRTS